MSRAERRLSRWLMVTGATYLLGAVDFYVRPWASTITLNQAGGEPIDHEPPGVYNSLASAYMATIATLALTAAKDPHEHAGLVPPLLVAKATSSAGMLVRYLQTGKRGFAVGAGVDAALFAVTAGLYKNLKR
jgi:hypothetical protein